MITWGDYPRWVREVRDPAEKGKKTQHLIEVDGAFIWYAVARLPSGRWAIHIDMHYTCGNLAGRGVPWSDHATREQCIEQLLLIARSHFGKPLADWESAITKQQREAQLAIRAVINDIGLFGWQEPAPYRR